MTLRDANVEVPDPPGIEDIEFVEFTTPRLHPNPALPAPALC
jgi:4-hydroxyphenylpyruvate dioxygenase-like putative hemolysin